MAGKKPLRRIVKSLDGRWQLAPLEQAMVDLSWMRGRFAWGTCEGMPFVTRNVTVPGAWNDGKDLELNLYRGACIYIKDVTVPKSFKGRVVQLRFGAVGYQCDIFIDGAKIGSHEGGHTPFSFDVTGNVKAGKKHRVVVIADNRRSLHTFPGPSADWESYGGIHRSVELVGLPAVHIEKALPIPTLDDSGRGELSTKVIVRNAEKRDRKATVSVDIKGVATRSREVKLPAGKSKTVTVRVKKLDVDPWSPETPAMYDLAVTVGGDCVKKRVGFRSIAIKGNKLLLNGRKIRLRGLCKHDDHPDHGPCMPESQIRADLKLLKDTNCNAVRLAHYPHQERVYELCDEMGLMVWAEIPFVGGDVSSGDVKTRSLKLQNMLREFIERDCHHPSIVLWSVGNEVASDTPAGKRFMKPLYDLVRKLDPTRLVTMASNRGTREITAQAYGDVVGVNEYMGWYSGDARDTGPLLDRIHRAIKAPIIISEFGAPADRGKKGSATTRWTERHQENVYRHQMKALVSKSYIVGIFPWNLIDFRSVRRASVAQRGLNRKGVTDERRRPKLAWKLLKDVYAKMAAGK